MTVPSGGPYQVNTRIRPTHPSVCPSIIAQSWHPSVAVPLQTLHRLPALGLRKQEDKGTDPKPGLERFPVAPLGTLHR